MKKQIELLVELQKKDRLVIKIQGQIIEGPKRIKAIERKLQSAEADIESHKVRIRELRKSQRQYETEIEDGVAHIRKSRGRLMAIKNNKEYRALIKEIEQAEKEVSEREDRILVCLEDQERLAEELRSREEALAGMHEITERERAAIEKELVRMEEELSRLLENRKELLQAIDTNLLSRYNRIKASSGGIAVSLVNNATCSECHMGIPPQMYNELQRQDSVPHCPHCQRLIYWKENDCEH